MAHTIAILGGTGALGSGLAIRWARAGHRIIIGSRTLEKAEEAVTALKAQSPETAAEAMDNAAAAAAGDIVVLTVPYAHQLPMSAYVCYTPKHDEYASSTHKYHYLVGDVHAYDDLTSTTAPLEHEHGILD